MDSNCIMCEKITTGNIDLAIKTQHTIFPHEDGSLNLKASADKKLIEEVYGKNYRKSVDFWLCKNQNNKIIGITGIYSYIEYPDCAWCGWFGILPEYQGKGFGKKLFLWTMEKAKEMGFKSFHLYTDLEDNKTAVELYRKIGMIEESYITEDMSPEKIVIFSKDLYSDFTEKFGNKNLFLKKQEDIQNRAKNF